MPLMRSWVDSANAPDCPFPLNNLPYGVFSTGEEEPRCGVAIGDKILDCRAAESVGLLNFGDEPLFDVPFWNEVMEQGPELWERLRNRLTGLLAEGSSSRPSVEPFLVEQAAATMHMPFLVSEYTDFYAGKHHATNVGTMFRGAENALPPNWLHIPIGYNGRASSVVVSGTDVRRPWGQLKGPNDDAPRFAPCARFDLELEMGAIVGKESDGPVTVKEADDMIFGYVLLNDWSARDIQFFESRPLGPHLGKSFATSISAWVTPLDELSAARVPLPAHDPAPLPYLTPGEPALGLDLDLAVHVNGELVASPPARDLYWSPEQMVAHLTSGGAGLRAGDLLGSGTVSGPERSGFGSMLELSWNGRDPVVLAGGASRTWLEDGDEVVMTATAPARDGGRVALGEVRGRIRGA
ncbi:fumarylacetoacetase [Marinovum algicola]|uniref:fumarylacetoacetase n=1 Tax=Marinovum algicola TaxID=42444 RepID=UPI0024BB2FD4|nr:fumarylacetoacetase [Marinovum algicola]